MNRAELSADGEGAQPVGAAEGASFDGHVASIGAPSSALYRSRLTAGFPRLSAQRLDEILLIGPLEGDEELAMWAFEPLMALGLTGEQLGLEGLLAVWADDLERGLLLGATGHEARIAP